MRQAIRRGQWRTATTGLVPGCVLANLAVLPAEDAADFQRFCELNPRPCPLLAVLPAGDPAVPASLASDADVRTDIPRYRLYRAGMLAAELDSLADVWHPDLVAFLLGCSFGFDGALLAEDLPVRHVEQGRSVPMFRTNQQCTPVGHLAGPLVVSYCPMPCHLLPRTQDVSAAYPLLYGSPVLCSSPIYRLTRWLVARVVLQE